MMRGHSKMRAYHTDFAIRVRRYALMGMTEEEVCKAFDCSARTLGRWRTLHPEFAHAYDTASRDATAQVVAALHKRAIGFTKRGLRKPMATKAGIVSVEYDEYYPPDVTAGLAWMRVHLPEKWGKPGEGPAATSGRLKVAEGVSIVLDLDTLALTGLPHDPDAMKDVTPDSPA